MRDLAPHSFELVETLPERKVFKHALTGDLFLASLEEEFPGDVHPPVRILPFQVITLYTTEEGKFRITMPILSFDHPNTDNVTQLTVEEALWLRDEYNVRVELKVEDMATRNLRELLQDAELNFREKE
jgi:hypothetical protein